MAENTGPDLPLSRPIAVDSIKASGQTMDVIATGQECLRVARFLGLASVEKLRARYKVTRNGDRAAIRGDIDADIHQICVVSLEPFPVHVHEAVTMRYASARDVAAMEARLVAEAEGRELDLTSVLDGDDLPEVIIDGRIDLGTATAEFLSLALDPYPRKPGVAFQEQEGGRDVAAPPPSPFAVLSKLKRDP